METLPTRTLRPGLRCIVFAGITLVAGVVAVTAVTADEDEKPQVQETRKIWQERARSSLPLLDEDSREYAVTFLVIALAEAGDSQRAKAVTKEFLPPDQRKSPLMMIATIESQRGQLDQALATMREVPETHRPTTLGLIANRQAQRGEIDKALSLLPQLKEPLHLDRVRNVVATAQAQAGDLDAARETASLIEDDDRRKQAEQEIERAKAGENDPIAEIPSRLLREQLSAMLLFTDSRQQREAIRAVAAAKRMDEAALAKHMQAAVEAHRKSLPVEQATMRMLLSLALAEAGRIEEAQAMLEAACKTSEENEVAGLFGNPVVIHLLIRLNRESELQALLDALRDEDDTVAGPLILKTSLQAMGRTYAELDVLQRAETRYAELKSPADRFHFAVGVLLGLAD